MWLNIWITIQHTYKICFLGTYKVSVKFFILYIQFLWNFRKISGKISGKKIIVTSNLATLQILLPFISCYPSNLATLQILLPFKSCYPSNLAILQIFLPFKSCYPSNLATLQILLSFKSLYPSNLATLSVKQSVVTLL